MNKKEAIHLLDSVCQSLEFLMLNNGTGREESAIKRDIEAAREFIRSLLRKERLEDAEKAIEMLDLMVVNYEEIKMFPVWVDGKRWDYPYFPVKDKNDKVLSVTQMIAIVNEDYVALQKWKKSDKEFIIITDNHYPDREEEKNQPHGPFSLHQAFLEIYHKMMPSEVYSNFRVKQVK